MKSWSSSRRALARRHANDAFAAAPLGAVGADVRALDQAVVREGDDDAFVGDQIFDRDFAFVRHDLGQARRGILFLDGLQFVLDDRQARALPSRECPADP